MRFSKGLLVFLRARNVRIGSPRSFISVIKHPASQCNPDLHTGLFQTQTLNSRPKLVTTLLNSVKILHENLES
jgi:hypothetical protein